jgi:membrane protein DedA with SNARE-associated domain
VEDHFYNFFNSIQIYTQNLNGFYIFITIFVSNFIENIFPPWPGDTINVFYAAVPLRSRGWEDWMGFGLGIWGGNILGALVMYYFGERILSFFVKKFPFLGEEGKSLTKLKSSFRKNAFQYVLLSRFSAGVRFLVSIACGGIRMNLVSFLTAFSISVFLWNGVLVGFGYLLGENWSKIIEWMGVYNKWILLLLGAFFGMYFLYQKKKPGDP